MKSVSIIGSAGSIGTQTLDVVSRHPHEFRVVGLASFNEVDVLERQVRRFKPKIVSLAVEDAAKELRKRLKGTGVEVVSGPQGLIEVAVYPNSTVVTAVVGSVGLQPTLEAIKAGNDIALANKETLVCAGEIVTKEVERRGAKLLPIDSEHCAIWQCKEGYPLESIERIILTCSGGPFRTTPKEDLDKVATVERALKHPKWNMGPKITIDSATLMNKGLEVIEAHWLFGIPYERIKVVIHPQSLVHSMVEFKDGSMQAQIGVHDMRIPIQYALSYPKRLPAGKESHLDFTTMGPLEFGKPDMERFPCLAYAYEAGKLGGTMPAAMNAANEVAVVEFFLKGKAKFGDIPRAVRKTMDAARRQRLSTLKVPSRLTVMNLAKSSPFKLIREPVFKKNPALEDILKADRWAREYVRSILNGSDESPMGKG